MSYIQVDARGCGAGKTRNTIIPRIRNNQRLGVKTLLVVPSKALQKEYASHFVTDEITVINGDNGRILEQYQTATTAVICLTHQGFLQTPTGCFDKTNTDLIIDEVFDPYCTETFKTSDSAGRVWVNFSEVFAWQDPVPELKPTVSPQPFFEMSVVQSTPPDIINTQTWRKISNPNWRLFANWETGNNLMNNANSTTTIGLELCESVLDHWSSVWIAAAVFDQTFMGHWMAANRIPYTAVYEFEPHRGSVNWHMPTEEFVWSKACRAANPDIETVFKLYCEANRTGRLIYNKNNDSDSVWLHGNKLTHNAHGINAYRDRLDYAFMTAIQPAAPYSNFLRERCGLSGKALAFALSGYTAYQLIMRTALRDPNNTQPVNVFALDTTMILGVMDLFDQRHSTHIPDIPVKDCRKRTRGKGSKSAPLTSTQRSQLRRSRLQAEKNTP
jgi:hypothetical protein